MAAKLCLPVSVRVLWYSVLCSVLPLVGASVFPAIFVFGDSLLDPGNAEKIPTLFKANHPPYGRDFVTHRPTGRFCNGLLCTDIIASLAGLPFPPAYLIDPNDILQGTSFATSGARVKNLTFLYPLLHRVDFFQQVGYFSDVRSQLVASFGIQQASVLLSKSLFFICLGSNDFTASDFASQFQKNPVTPNSTEAFRNLIISLYEQNILDLYNLGGRKFALASLSVLGCIPFQLLISQSVDGNCAAPLDDMTVQFNAELLLLSQRLQSFYTDAHFTYLNTYSILSEIISDPGAFGFDYSSTACCGSGAYRGLPCYNKISTVCENASQYVFWDFAHPTQAVNEILASRFWAGSAPDVSPINVMQLATL